MDWIIFFKELGLTILCLFLLLGFVYWIRIFFNKIFPDFKYWFKYKVRKKPFNSDAVESLSEDIENNISKEEVIKTILMRGYGDVSQAKEIAYIYNELQRRYKENEWCWKTNGKDEQQ